jgi:hypothetical protein
VTQPVTLINVENTDVLKSDLAVPGQCFAGPRATAYNVSFATAVVAPSETAATVDPLAANAPDPRKINAHNKYDFMFAPYYPCDD